MGYKMHEPIGNGAYAGLLLRLPLGAYFAMAGLMKIRAPQEFIGVVQSYKVIPEPFSTLYAILLPYIEVGSGIMLILGIWTTLAAFLCSLMLTSFLIAIGIRDHHPFNKDIILLGASLSLLYSGPGAWSIDRFRKAG
jgi:uncharacterized membrane protein YphA (DoxX/SURF4 family)